MLISGFHFNDEEDLAMFMEQLAATVIFICEQREASSATIPEKDDAKGYDPIAQVMSRYVYWASHGYTNALQRMVELLHAYAEEIVNTNPLGIGNRRQMTADALSAYQGWKTALVTSEDRGSQTSFSLKDWTDLNEQLLVGISV